MKKFYGLFGYINFVATPATEVDDATQRISHYSQVTYSIGALWTNSLKRTCPLYQKVRRITFWVYRVNEKESTVDIVVDFRGWCSKGSSKRRYLDALRPLLIDVEKSCGCRKTRVF
jgi:uncharacterized FlgJ-related protein